MFFPCCLVFLKSVFPVFVFSPNYKITRCHNFIIVFISFFSIFVSFLSRSKWNSHIHETNQSDQSTFRGWVLFFPFLLYFWCFFFARPRYTIWLAFASALGNRNCYYTRTLETRSRWTERNTNQINRILINIAIKPNIDESSSNRNDSHISNKKHNGGSNRAGSTWFW